MRSSVSKAVNTIARTPGFAVRSARQRLNAIQPGHREVEQDHVRRQLGRPLNRLRSRSSLSDYLEIWLRAEHGREAIAHDRVIVGDEDTNRGSHGSDLGLQRHYDFDDGTRQGAALKLQAAAEQT